MSSSRTRYTTLYGNRLTRSCRLGRLVARGAPISGCVRIKLIVSTIASKSSAPRPARCCSYQRIASVSSAVAGSLLWNGFTGRADPSRCAASLVPRARAGSYRPRWPRSADRFRHSRHVRHQRPSDRRGSPRVRPRVRRGLRNPSGVRPPTRLERPSSCRDLTPMGACRQPGGNECPGSSTARGSFAALAGGHRRQVDEREIVSRHCGSAVCELT